jgi:alpha-amylase/alpha-mannosidase (GH57 family)
MSQSGRYAVVHGHFYQPPREDPWLESVPVEPSSAPYHDWNERITTECYAANANARRLDPSGQIVRIVNNYRRISFNFGPTLIAWLERAAADTYAAILAADRESAARSGGHGNAIAQAYNHPILPLANARDKQTQVRWGLIDFAHRFGRAAEGMWLPETAVDVDSLEALAAEGVRFTVLAPHQARRVRRLSGATERPGTGEDRARDGSPGEWCDVAHGGIDTRHPYLCRLPSGRSIALFFYDGALARSVAFDGALHSGDELAESMCARFDGRKAAQVVHLATDGESYGHHHRFGEMALAAAIEGLEKRGIRVTSYAAFLAEHPPEHEVEIAERTAWSCAHGVERWRAGCGCRTGGHPSWSQEWRSGLRRALDALAGEIDGWYEVEAGALVGDPWALRDDFGTVLGDDTRQGLRDLLVRHAGRPLARSEAARLARLLEAQRARLLMFTSCGWFFDELTGLEATQVLRYAARALELASAGGLAPSSAFLDHLAQARSNRPEVGSGADYFRTTILGAAVTPRQIALAGTVERLVGVQNGLVGHPPIAVDIDAWIERTQGAFEGDVDVVSRAALGVSGLIVGHARVRDARTLEDHGFVVAAHRHGSFDVIGAAQPAAEAGQARVQRAELVQALEAAFERRAHGTLVAEISRRLGPDFVGHDVLGTVSRAAFFPALVSDVEAMVASRLAEFTPLARAIAREARGVGAAVPPAIALVLDAAGALAGSPRPEADFFGLLGRLETVLRPWSAVPPEPPGEPDRIRGGEATVAALVARLGRALDERRAASRPFLLEPAQEFLWWRIWARAGTDAAMLAALEPLLEPLRFSAEAPAMALHDVAFASLLRVVSAEVRAAHEMEAEPGGLDRAAAAQAS